MHILADADVSKLIQTLQQRIPQEVLAAVARAGPDGLTQGAVVRAVNRLFPSTVDQDALREQALASLAWFRYHGDVHAGAYRYRIMPPYAVALDTASAQTAQITVQLCGDPRRDVDLTEQLATLGLALSTVTVDRDRRGPQGLVPVAVGWRRHVTLAPAQLPDVRACCERCQQPVISAAELGQRLPTIDGLLVPPQSACNVPPPWAGEWAAYAPSLPDGNRWQAIDSWRAGAQRVLRWCSDDAEDRRPVYRYFYHRGKELLAELSQSSAALWTFRLDHQASRPRRLWVDGTELWLPADLPDPHRQWIQLQAERVRWWMDPPSAQLAVPALPVAQRLAATLGLHLTPTRPS